MKMCKKCKQKKDKVEFYKDNSKNDGLRVYCKECDHKNRQKNYHNNKEHELENRKNNHKKKLDNKTGI